MSFHEEDTEKDSSGHNLELGVAAAAAMGVGVGAALYYSIKKRPETPTAEGSTSRNWNFESPNSLPMREEALCNSDNSYTTLSEYSTTATTIFGDSISCKSIRNNDSENETSDEESSDSETQKSSFSTVSRSTSDDETDIGNDESDDDAMDVDSSHDTNESDLSESDDTASAEHRSYEPPLPRNYSENHVRRLSMLRQNEKRSNELNTNCDEAFRERSLTLEKCSICFDAILRDQEIMWLPCTHNFHTKCILPWLQKRQTCPNCRKSIDY